MKVFREDDSASCSSLFYFLFYFFGNRGVSMSCVFQKTKLYLLCYVLNYVLFFLLYDIVMGGCYTQVRYCFVFFILLFGKIGHMSVFYGHRHNIETT